MKESKKTMKNLRTEQDLKGLIKEIFKGKKVKVYLFGSRAKEKHSESSDFDLAFLAEEDISKELTILRYVLEESNFPYKVDIVEPNKAGYLKEIVLKEEKKMVLKKLVEDFEKALKRLKEAYELANLMKDKEYCEFFRDSAIQRFEFPTEVMWKILKEFLRDKEGIICKSPKSCMLLKAIDDRNRTSHTYHEEVAEEIFCSLGEYIPLP